MELDLCVVKRGIVPLLAVRLPILRVGGASFSGKSQGTFFRTLRKMTYGAISAKLNLCIFDEFAHKYLLFDVTSVTR